MSLQEEIEEYFSEHQQGMVSFSSAADIPVDELAADGKEKRRHLRDLASLVIMDIGSEVSRLAVMPTLERSGNNTVRFQTQDCFITAQHSHNHVELVYTVKGRLHQRIGGEDVFLEEGNFCLIDSGVNHCEVFDREKCTALFLGIDEIFFSSGITGRNGQNLNTALRGMVDARRRQYLYSRFTKRGSRQERLSERTMERVVGEFMNSWPNRQHIIVDEIERLLVLLPREYQIDAKDADRKSLELATAQDMLEYIRDNYPDVTVSGLARVYNYSPDYLERICRRVIGQSLSSAIQEVRMQKAMDLLLKTKRPVSEISAAVGYQNVSFFYRKFREMYHCSPGEVRDQAGK